MARPEPINAAALRQTLAPTALATQTSTEAPTIASAASSNGYLADLAQAARTRQAGDKPTWRRDWRPSLGYSTSWPARATDLDARKLTAAQAQAVDRLVAAMGQGESAALLGQPGQGKTSMARIVGDRLGLDYLYLSIGALFSTWKSWFGIDTADLNHNRRVLMTCPLVVIDDVQVASRSGTNALTDTEAQCLTAVVHERYDARRPTLLVSNQTAESLARLVGPAIADRLAGGAVVECGWPSFRGGAA